MLAGKAQTSFCICLTVLGEVTQRVLQLLLTWGQDNAEPHKEVPVVRVSEGAERGTAVSAAVEPTASVSHVVEARWRTLRINHTPAS